MCTVIIMGYSPVYINLLQNHLHSLTDVALFGVLIMAVESARQHVDPKFKKLSDHQTILSPKTSIYCTFALFFQSFALFFSFEAAVPHFGKYTLICLVDESKMRRWMPLLVCLINVKLLQSQQTVSLPQIAGLQLLRCK